MVRLYFYHSPFIFLPLVILQIRKIPLLGVKILVNGMILKVLRCIHVVQLIS